MTEVELTVVIPAHNAAATLAAQLDALGAQEWDGRWEIVLVDNLSTDATVAIALEYGTHDARLRVVEARDQPRIGHARNTGITAARGRSIAMCDSDDVVGAGWVAAIGNALRAHEFVAGALDVHTLNAAELVATRGRAIEREQATFQGVFPVAHSCNMAFRRDVVTRIGGFAEDLVNGSDVDFSHRAFRAGIVCHYEPAAVVAYRYRATNRALFRQARNYGKVNAQLVAKFRAAGTHVEFANDWKGWVFLARRLPSLTSPSGRANWAWSAGTRVGRAEGRWRHRQALRESRRWGFQR
ncbi:MAG TPA: glycosyltransferase [Acidimicrobiia bacterium]